MNFNEFRWFLLKILGFRGISGASENKLGTATGFNFDSGTFSLGFWHYYNILYGLFEAKYFLLFLFVSPTPDLWKMTGFSIWRKAKNVSKHIFHEAETKKNRKNISLRTLHKQCCNSVRNPRRTSRSHLCLKNKINSKRWEQYRVFRVPERWTSYWCGCDSDDPCNVPEVVTLPHFHSIIMIVLCIELLSVWDYSVS